MMLNIAIMIYVIFVLAGVAFFQSGARNRTRLKNIQIVEKIDLETRSDAWLDNRFLQKPSWVEEIRRSEQLESLNKELQGRQLLENAWKELTDASNLSGSDSSKARDAIEKIARQSANKKIERS